MSDNINSQMERFLREQNIQRYHKLLEHLSDDMQRQKILNLLQEEETSGREAEISAARRSR